jgi:hypothetical protein
MQVALSLDGAFDEATPRQLLHGVVGQVLRGLQGSQGVTLIPRANGIEDFVLLEHPQREARVSYRIRLTRVAGLRQVGNVLEFLDSGGAPRLRIPPVTVIDSTGLVIRARLGVEGCAVDRDPRAPWGRPVVAPGSDECRVVVDWTHSPVVYPVLVDPTWQSTSTLADARYSHGQVTLTDGRVLVAGGGGAGYYAAIGELWDPTTGTWAVTGENSVSHKFTTMEALLDGRALLIGGCQAADPVGCYTGVDVAEIYSPATGTWSETQMIGNRYNHASARLADGRVIVAGGCPTTLANCVSDANFTAEIFDPATNTWALTSSIGTRRAFFSAVAMDDGTAIFTGGTSTNAMVVATAQRFDGSSWSTLPNLVHARFGHATARLPAGRLLVAGGCVDSECTQMVSELEYFDPTTNQFAASGALSPAVANLTATRSSQDTVLLVGGRNDNGSAEFDTYLFDPIQWNLGPAPLLPPRFGHAASRLFDGRVMVTAGADTSALDDTYLFVPDILDPLPEDGGVGGSAGLAGAGGSGGQSFGGFGGAVDSGVSTDSGLDGGLVPGGSSSSGCLCSFSETRSQSMGALWAMACIGITLRRRVRPQRITPFTRR